MNAIHHPDINISVHALQMNKCLTVLIYPNSFHLKGVISITSLT